MGLLLRAVYCNGPVSIMYHLTRVRSSMLIHSILGGEAGWRVALNPHTVTGEDRGEWRWSLCQGWNVRLDWPHFH